MIVWYLTIGLGIFAAICPEPYPTEAACVKAAKDSKIFLCSRAETSELVFTAPRDCVK